MENMEKRQLLEDIEKLLSFDGNDTEINPNYLEYFTIDELISIKKELEKKYANMVEDNLEWMQQFKKQ
ncbi:hypothetical protein RZR97_11245 [Hydrogenimonas thermophila]|uniref:hypothetical protein n=1 Tax=Hydrogenimonas thermophila TaxID=223786 RepID=UPI00293714F2|nr:hypothetical protein [Hydrogenimonas thermophila]WOE69671.1 hypothetical protein RZR91_11255 [Hydrogenimonas thermophila]WOE72185.1 hypothetical protein RZR97_11245 [Hydrogenimonas thermophila]